MAAKRHLAHQPQPSSSTDDAAPAAFSSSGEEEPEITKKSTDSPAPKLAPPPRPSAASETSSGEEDGEDDEEGSEEGERDDDDKDEEGESAQQQQQQQQQSMPLPKRPEPSDSDAESDDDSDSDSSDGAPLMAVVTRPSRAVDPSIKPISSRSMDGVPTITALPNDQQSQKRKREDQRSQQGKRDAPEPASPENSGRKERVSQDKTPQKRKREASEQAGVENGDSQKRPLFQRLWSFEDEVAILRGLVDYRKKVDIVPSYSQDMIPFLDFVQGSLQMKVSKTQLQDKVRRLRKKFETNVARLKKDAGFSFSSAHERTCYELSKSLWEPKETKPKNKIVGSDIDDRDENQSESEEEDQNTKKKSEPFKEVSKQTGPLLNNNEDPMKSKLDFPYLWESVGKIANEVSCGVAIKMSLEKLDAGRASVLDEKVRKLKMKEIKLHLRKIDLVKEVVKLILDGLSTVD